MLELEQDLSAVTLVERQVTPRCILCDVEYRPFADDVSDFEYGVEHESSLVICPKCGLVTHEPAIEPDDIPGLYPSNYLAHSAGSEGGKNVYSELKLMLAKRAAKQIVSRVPKNGVFLEIGCGNCHLIKLLAELRPDMSFVGVDIEKVDVGELPRFNFYHGQFETSDVPSQNADLIYCSNLIEHVPDPRRFLAKCADALKPGGTLYGVTPNHLSIDRFVFGRHWAGYHYPRHTYVFNHHNLKTLLTSQGFVDPRITGSYSFWYLSLANRFLELPGTRKRGLAFAAITAAFLPFDVLLNLFTCHGSMTFVARTK